MGKVIGIGECVYDIIFKNDTPINAVPGGSAFNAIISLGRMQMPCCMITEVGDDHIGDITCNYLRTNGVDTTYVNRVKGTRSHLSLAFLNGQNDANYAFYKDHASVSEPNEKPVIKACDTLLFGSYYAINPLIRESVFNILHCAKTAGATLYYDVNFRASHIHELPIVIDNIVENMRLASVVRGSAEDFNYIFGTCNVDELYEKHIPCKCFICTDAGNPVQVRTPNLRTSFDAMPINTVSTVGAGDNFNAGFIYALQSIQGNAHQSIQGDTAQAIKLSQLNATQWEYLIGTAQQFSSNVCQQSGNSVSQEFVKQMLNKKY